jgi:hypothetical protein
MSNLIRESIAETGFKGGYKIFVTHLHYTRVYGIHGHFALSLIQSPLELVCERYNQHLGVGVTSMGTVLPRKFQVFELDLSCGGMHGATHVYNPGIRREGIQKEIGQQKDAKIIDSKARFESIHSFSEGARIDASIVDQNVDGFLN